MHTQLKLALLGLTVSLLAACATGPQLSPEELELQKTSYANAVKLLKKKRYEKALTMLQEIHLQQPQKPGPLLNMAIAQAKLKRPQEAIQTFQRALDNDPQNPSDRANAYNQMGIIYSASGQFGEAEDMFEEALDEDPKYADAWFNLGLLYEQKMQRPQEAIKAWQNYVNLDGKSKDIATLWIQELQLQIANASNNPAAPSATAEDAP